MSVGFRCSRSAWLAGLTAAALVSGLLTVAGAPPASAGGGASLDLTKTVTSTGVVPTMAATLAVDRSSAIPGDQLSYTARVTNTGAVVTVKGSYSATESADSAGTISDWYEEVEYHDPVTKAWIPLGGYQATNPGWTPAVPSPATIGLTVDTTPVASTGVSYPGSGDHLLGTVIGAGKKANWSYTAQLTLTAAQVGVLADAKRSDGIRNVVHVEVSPRDPKNGQPYTYRAEFANPFAAGAPAVTGVSVTFTLPDGSTRTIGQNTVAALASIAAGASVTVPTKWTLPVLALPGTNEADAAYLSRLAAAEGSVLSASATATGTGGGTTRTATAPAVSTTEHLPILSVGKSGPATVDAGATGHYQLPLQNTGGAGANGIALTDTVPAGGTATVSGTPTGLTAGAGATATAAFPVPDDQPDGPLTDTASVRWADANGNGYGPVSASFTTTVQSSLVGATLSLAPETAGPDVVGTDQALTATLVDRNGKPVPNIAVTLAVTGTNSVTGTITTDSAGKAGFHYAGTAAGLDTAQAEATAGTLHIQSNTAQIGWVKPIAPIGTTAVDGRFFTEPTGATTFVAKPGDVPTFGQTFPNLAFNPSAAALPHNLTGVGTGTHPFTDVTTDLMGNGVGAIQAQGNGKQAGGAGMTSFDAVFTADFVVAKPGDVTFRFDYDAGFLFGVGGGASRVNGSYENTPASNRSAFENYPLAGADNRPNNAVRTTTVTVHFPSAGTYPYEVDYTEAGGQTLSLVLSTLSFTEDKSGITAYVGYADGLRPGGSDFPFPWNGSPNTVFVGCQGNCEYEGGAVRLDNTTGHTITINSLTVDLGPNCRFAIWPHDRQLPDGQTAIYTQTISGADSGCPTNGTFDTSDAPYITCNPTHIIPRITFTIDGEAHSFDDENQVLNTKGIDPPSCGQGNETQPWSRIGGDGVGINTPLPPAGSVVLSPLAGGSAKVTSVQADAGTAQSFRIDVLDASGLPVGNAPVDLAITGAHPGHVRGTTGADGTTDLSYTALSSGDDSVQAITFISGMRTLSGTVSVRWSLPAGTVPDPDNPGQTLPAPAPTIAILSPADGSRVTAPEPVRATVTPPDGETVTSWTASYQAVSPGSPKVTLAHGDGPPPATLATFDPTILPNDSYTLTVSATSSNGGLQAATTTVNVDGKLKLGRYVTTYKDVDTSVNGLPMKVLRSYDSTDPRVGDFGVGWQVSVGNFRISANRTLGAGGWTEYPAQCSFFGCQYAFKSSTPHTVTVTFPDQHEEKFAFTPAGGFSAFYFLGDAAFTPIAGTGVTSTLEAVDADIAYDFGGNLRSGINGPLYSPTRFKLTTKDGKVFLLDTASGLVSETDPAGNSISVDGSGVHGSNGQSITFTKDVTGRITKITEPGGQEISYGYSTAGDLTSVHFPDGVSAGYSYDASHHLTGSTGGESESASTVEYDDAGRAVAITDGAGNRTALDSNVTGQQQIVHDPSGKLTTIYTYDDLGDLLKKDQIFNGRTLTATFAYDSTGRVTDIRDPLGSHEHWVYDESEGSNNGDLLSHTDGTGHTTRFSGYDAHGHPATVSDNAGQVIASLTYDPSSGLLLQSQIPGLPPTTHAYYPNGLLRTTVDTAGQATTLTYDGYGHVLSQTDSAGHATTYLVDSAGHPLRVTDESGNATDYSYDGAGKLTGVHRPDGTALTYDHDQHGLVSAVTDGGGVTRYSYDDRGLVSQRTDRNGAVTAYQYDVHGQLVKETRPGNDVTTYQYDPLERLVEADNGDAEVTFSYDDAGNVDSQTTCAPQPQHAECSASGGNTALPTTKLDYSWDSTRRQLSVTTPAGLTSYHYDLDGRLDALTDPSGDQVKHHYDNVGRLSTIDLPNGIVDTFSYDSASMLAGLDATLGGSTVSRSDYTLDPVTAQRTTSTDLDGTTTYTYQDNGWLTAAKHPDSSGFGAETFSYDGAGRRTAWTDTPAASVSHNPAGQLVTAGTLAFAYDNEGDLISKIDTATGARTAYHWNTDHQLTSIDLPDGTISSYRYDPLGRRVETTDGSHTARYAYDGVNVVAVYDDSNRLLTSYVTTPTYAGASSAADPGEVVELREGSATRFYLHDGSGSTTALTDESGTVTARYHFSAFGVPAADNGRDSAYTYTGSQYDTATALYYLRDRYYDPGIGQFLSQDPPVLAYFNPPLGQWTHTNPGFNPGDPMTLAPYAYVANDPVNASDPSGDSFRSASNKALFCFKLVFCAIEMGLSLSPQLPTPVDNSPVHVEAPGPEGPEPIDTAELREDVEECLGDLAEGSEEAPREFELLDALPLLARRGLSGIFRAIGEAFKVIIDTTAALLGDESG